ncbi:MAG: diphosphomevalonate decarboxylase [bacterium]
MRAAATARANVALVKYWGNRDDERNVPATGSISVTLRDLTTRTEVVFQDGIPDSLQLDGAPASAEANRRVRVVLDLVRAAAGLRAGATVRSENDFPTGAGLASSASGFAALALAASRAAGLALEPAALSALARRGSGSAARSVLGGFAELAVGIEADGLDAVAEPLYDDSWPLAVLVVVTDPAPKAVTSAEGMRRTVATAPFYNGWLRAAPDDLAGMRAAIRDHDLPRLGELAEHSCLKLHGLMLSTRPALLYWNHTTLRVVQAVLELRRLGRFVYFTVDAGPQVKVLCAPGEAAGIRRELAGIDGVQQVLSTGPGPGVLIEDLPA